MTVDHKKSRNHGEMVAIIWDSEEEYKMALTALEKNITTINNVFGEKHSEYMQHIKDVLERRYTVNEKYNDGKASSILFDSDIKDIHYDYFFNMIWLLQEKERTIEILREQNQESDETIKLLKEQIDIQKEHIDIQKKHINALQDTNGILEHTIKQLTNNKE